MNKAYNVGTENKKEYLYKGAILMFEIIVSVLFFALFFWCIKLAFKLAWGTAKIIATVLLVLAVPALILCLVLGAGVVLLAPVCMVVGAVTLLKFFCR